MEGIKNQYNIDLRIGGKKIIATHSNVLNLNTIENQAMHLPTIQMSIQDDDGELAAIVRSGTDVPIELTFGDGGKSGEQTATWLIQGQPSLEHSKGTYIVHMEGMLDKVQYARKIVSGLYEGNASDVISKIAGEVGLTFKGDSSNDSQVWLPNNKSLAGYATHVVNRAYAGATSVFAKAVNEGSELLMKDLSKLTNGGTVFGLGDGAIPILTYSSSSMASLANHTRAAGSHSSGYDPEGVFQELTKVTATFVGNTLGFSESFQSSIGDLGGRLDTIIRDAGNVHAKYQEALHQNKRLRSMLSHDLQIVIDNFSGTSILEGATAIPPSFLTTMRDSVNKTLAGNYIVSTKTRSLQGSQYFEKLTLTNQG